MKLFLTRHGETDANKEHIVQGFHPDGEVGTLTELGEKQARMLAQRLKKEHFDIIIVSDLKRTRQTAQEILKHHPNTEVDYNPLFRERDLGPLVGMSYEEAGIGNDDWQAKLPENAENNRKLMARAQKALEFLMKQHMNKRVLVVAHGAFNAMLESAIRGLDPDDYCDLIMHHAAVSVFEIEEDGAYKIHVHNCSKHLL